MWSTFRAIAARIGLTSEQVEAVERGGEATLVQDPLNSEISYKVRPDPNWTERMNEAWQGTLVNSRRELAGTVPVPDGQLVITDLNSPEKGVTVLVSGGEYEVILTIAHLGAKKTYDFEEHVSHAFALLRDNKGVALIEPLTDDNGNELVVNAATLGFTGAGVIHQVSADHPDVRLWTVNQLQRLASLPEEVLKGMSARVQTSDESGALIAFKPGTHRQDFPLFRIADTEGNTIGVLMDFFVDNRPYSD